MFEAVAGALGQAKAGDPLTRCHVLVPTGRSGQSLARRLARSGGVANTTFVTMTRLAAALTPHSAMASSSSAPPGSMRTGTGRRLSADVRRELARITAAGARPPLGDHASPVLVQALVKVFGELRNRSTLELEALADTGPLAGELVRLFTEYRRLASEFVDDRDVVETATRHINNATAPVVAVITQPPAPHESGLLDALFLNGKLQVVGLRSGDPAVDDALAFALNGLGAPVALPVSELPEPTCLPVSELPVLPVVDQIVIAPDADVEVQLAIGKVLTKAKQGVAFGRMALLYGSASPYALVVHDQLRAAGIPVRGRSPIRLSASVAGRFVLGLLNIVDEAFSLEAVAEWITSGPVKMSPLDASTDHPVKGRSIDAARWMRIARRAGVTSGLAQWEQRLKPDERRGQSKSHDAGEMLDFIAEIGRFGNVDYRTWSEWTVWLQLGIDRYLAPASARGEWPRVEAEMAQQVEAMLVRLGALDDIGAPVERNAFRAAVADELEATHAPERAPGGLLVGTPRDASGCDLDFVIICGLAEGVLPPPTATSGFLNALYAPGQERSADAERRNFLLAIAGSQESVLMSPRSDQRAQRQHRPSPWLLEQASVLAGRSVSADALICERTEWPWLKVLESFAASIETGDVAATTQLEQLRRLNRWVQSGKAAVDFVSVGGNHRIGRGIETVVSRNSSAATRFDGIIGEQPLTAIGAGTTLSARRLSDWATCPFRYFLSTVLAIDEPIDDDDPLKLAAKDRGLLVHATLERFLLSVAPRVSPGAEWTAGESQLLHDIADELYENVRRDGRSPQGLLWEAELRALHANLDAFLRRDTAVRRARGMVTDPQGIEVSFGADGNPPVVVERANGTPVAFRGRIDRVDRSVDGKRVSVIDYKTGRADSLPKLEPDPVVAGKVLQLALYGEAVAQAHGGADVNVDASYWFVADSKNQYPERGIQIDEQTRARLREVVSMMADGIEAGAFPAVPGSDDWKSYENCRNCAYDRVCATDRGEAWARKSDESAMEPFHRLGEGEQ